MNLIPSIMLASLGLQESRFQAIAGSCNAAIAAWRKAGDIQHALDILPYMKLNKILPTVLTYERLLAACGDAGLWQVHNAIQTFVQRLIGVGQIIMCRWHLSFFVNCKDVALFALQQKNATCRPCALAIPQVNSRCVSAFVKN